MRVLIFRTGSIGDTIVSLPALRVLKKYYSNASLYLLTNFPVTDSGKESPLSSVLDGEGIICEFIEYPAKKVSVNYLFRLRKIVSTIKPEALVYLMPQRNKYQLMRDWIFFKLCGVRKIHGLNFSSGYQRRMYDPINDRWEHEAQRLCRLIGHLGQIDLNDDESWRLSISNSEHIEARQALHNFENKRFLALSIGTKADTKDWGEDNWLELTKQLSRSKPGFGLVLIGSIDEYELSQRIAKHWLGPVLNLCGKCAPRISAAALSQASLYLGHDSGPMHLAAAVGTPVVAIFSSQNKPGEWYPLGEFHNVLYNKTECFGCNLNVCVLNQKKCIRGISVDSVFKAVTEHLRLVDLR